MINRVPVLAWFLVPTIALVIGGVWFFSRPTVLGEKADTGKPEAVSTEVKGTVNYPIASRLHISQGTKATDYNSNPPSSGQHWHVPGLAPAKPGIYDRTLDDEILVHNLEHGYVWISYIPPKTQSSESTSEAKLGIADDDVNRLKEIVQKDDWKIVMESREANDSKIALVAWGRVLKMDDIDYDKVKAFIKTYRNRGPENTPD